MSAQSSPDPREAYLKPQVVARLPDGRRLIFTCMGEGRPTTILEAGWGTLNTSWKDIQPRLAKLTRVCVVDRAGYGFSDPGPLPRDSSAAVADLHNGLKAAGLRGPFVLVGHSLAGFDVRLHAYTYPKEVAGLLLLDPPTENIYRRDREPDEDLDFIRRCIAIAKVRVVRPKDHCAPPRGHNWSDVEVGWMSRLGFYESLLSEDQSMVTVSADELATARHSLGDMPLVVLQAEASPDDERSKELAGMARDSSRGVYRIVAGSRHYIYRDRPDEVVSALGDILRAVRSSTN